MLDRVRAAAVAAALGLAAGSARACPLCDSATGERVRAGIFGADFGANLAFTILPFAVFLAVAALIHFGLPVPKRRARAPEAEEMTWSADEAAGR